jgi:catechol 2,3-dioxygenase-like lactoylglutathione lyase family enzyme
MEQSITESAPWPTNLFAITLFVENLEIAKEFYHRAFGLPIDYEDNNSVVYKLGETLINLLKTSAAPELIQPAKVGGRGDGSRFVFTIHVEDVDCLCARLISRDVKLLNGPMDRPWGIRTASFQDPDGYIWEIAK